MAPGYKFLSYPPGAITYLTREEWNRTMDTADLLVERGKTHGKYEDHARITQRLKRVMEVEVGFETLSDAHKEALHMIQHKIGRILAGNPKFNDHWDDIAGYAKLGSEACDG